MRLLIIMFCTCLCGTIFSQADEKIKHDLFCVGVNDIYSTTPTYVVVLAKDLKTDSVKEVCTEGPFVLGALRHETGEWSLKCKDYPSRYFEFQNDSALWNLGFDMYSQQEFEEYSSGIDVQSIVSQVKAGELSGRTFMGHPKEQRMFAHLMFNHGVRMRRGSLAGNVCSLSYHIVE